MLSSILLLALPALIAAAQVLQDCNQFWPTKLWDPLLSDCVQDTDDSFPKAIQGVNLDIYHFKDHWHDTANTSRVLDATRLAAVDAVNSYSAFAAGKIPDIKFIIVDHHSKSDADTEIPSPGQDCLIRIFLKQIQKVPASINISQVVAHEIYHCIEGKILNKDFSNLNPDPSDWWIEGGAEYMSNVVYGTANFEYIFEENFSPSRPLYKHRYSTASFFQWMESTGTAETVHNFLVDQMPAGAWPATPEAERARLSGLSDIGDMYTAYMHSFISDSIEDSDGVQVIPESHLDVTVFTSPNLDPSTTFSIYLQPFTGNVSIFSLDQGQTVTMAYSSPQSKIQVQYRPDSHGPWLPMPDSSAPVTLTVPCGDAGLAIQVLTVSTDDVAMAQADIVVTKTSDLNCNCNTTTAKKTKRDGPPSSCPVNDTGNFDSCLVGTWSLDLDNMKSLLITVLANSNPPSTVSGLTLSGSGLLSISAPSSSTAASAPGNMTYTNLEIDMTVEAEGLSVPGTTTINGDIGLNFNMAGAGQFTLTVTSSSGEVDIEALGVPITIDLGDGFVPASMVIKYTCTGNTLGLTGFVNGVVQTSWIYSFTKI